MESRKLDIRHSYTAANTFPFKLLRRINEFVSLKDRHILPGHVQLCPTNKCNLSCPFCSCKDRDRAESIPIETLCQGIDVFTALGTRAVTVTGGGEPCCYPDLGDLILYLQDRDIQVGMVSNGLLLGGLSEQEINALTWCRVSVSDDRNIVQLLDILLSIIKYAKIDWAFSYVVTANFDIEKCIRIIEFANIHKFTHVRLVSDLMNLETTPEMHDIEDELKKRAIDDSLVIYQGRQDYERGYNPCHISLLKPVVAPDGWLYPCCGVQYAIDDSTGMFPEQMRMCKLEDTREYFLSQKAFDGSICDRCYYQGYNLSLELLLEHYDHEMFI